VHISGLEVEGLHPRALMESALVCLEQVIGLYLGPAPMSGLEQAGLAVFAITRIILQSRRNFPFCSA
jgi:hypothetical protein